MTKGERVPHVPEARRRRRGREVRVMTFDIEAR